MPSCLHAPPADCWLPALPCPLPSAEGLTEHFHRTVMDLTNEKSTVVVCNELRSHSVQGTFMRCVRPRVRAVPNTRDAQRAAQRIVLHNVAW